MTFKLLAVGMVLKMMVHQINREQQLNIRTGLCASGTHLKHAQQFPDS